MAKLKTYKISMEFEATDIVDAEMFIVNNTTENWLEHLEEEE
tara:strand:+ start:395 stop:520 length:126 start_codon:yes stop_codon:yes gene_type:complete